MENKIYKKNDILKVDITDLDTDGNGIGKVDGYTLFIKDTYPGDKCLVKIMKAKKSYAFAHLEEIIMPSLDRVGSKCERAKACGGCTLQGLSYEAQVRYKQNKIVNNLVRLGGFDKEYIESICEPFLESEVPYRYRNKAQYPVGYNKSGELITGFYAGHSHNIIPVRDCMLGPMENREILNVIFDWMRDCKIGAYVPGMSRGIRHILIRKGYATGEIMVCLVVSTNKIFTDKNCDILVKGLQNPNDNICSVSYSVNSADTNVIMGDNYQVLYGKPTICDYIGSLKFEISPLSFYQVNPAQTVRLYGKALEYANLSGNEIVWDLYCGIGTISLFMAQKAGKVFGVEIVPQAIEDAEKNAQINGLTNTEFYVGKAEEVLPREVKNDVEKSHPDVIVVDPPRKGCDEQCLNTMLQIAPARIVYVSCDSATLARDLRILVDGGYTLTKVCGCDMFSQTVHVETVVLMSKVNTVKG